MHLYNFLIQPPTSITHAITGTFSDPKLQAQEQKQQEILVARGNILELYRQDASTQKLVSLYSQQVFGVIRSLTSFRQTGEHKDYIAVGSDSGRIVIMEFDGVKNRFVKVHQETFGKTGCRRIVPGQYITSDPKGRAIMISAVEKQKFVYILNRDPQSQRLTISSPLEAPKSHTLVYSMTSIDVGFANPMFAAIELDYSAYDDPEASTTLPPPEQAKKQLSWYELDTGLNSVVKKHSMIIDASSHLLVSVPGGTDGPSGVLVFSDSTITYKNIGHADITCTIPRRWDMNAKRSLMTVATCMHKKKNMFFYMIQSEMGDLYRVDLDVQNNKVTSVKANYFDTIPVATSLCILRTGYLFAASEAADHKLYKFKSIGDDIADSATTFQPQTLKHLFTAQVFESTAPIMDMKVKDLLNEGQAQFYCACGKGSRSSLRVLKYGTMAREIAQTPLGSQSPTGIWVVKKHAKDTVDKYIIISFAYFTMVLAIDAQVTQIQDSGLLDKSQTLSASLLAEDHLLQICPQGMRYIGNKKIHEWDANTNALTTTQTVSNTSTLGTAKNTGNRTIAKCAVNSHQVVIAMTGGELIYFEWDNSTQQLIQLEKKDMGQEIACLAIAPPSTNSQKSRFLAVGFYDKTVRILSLNHNDCFHVLTRQVLKAEPESCAITNVQQQSYLHIGLNNGMYIRSAMDPLNGELSDSRVRVLGGKAVKLIRLEQSNSLLALTSKPFFMHPSHSNVSLLGNQQWVPLSFKSSSAQQSTPTTLDYAAAFSSKEYPEGFVAISGHVLRVLALPTTSHSAHLSTPQQHAFLSPAFYTSKQIPLKYTPRKMIIHPGIKKLILIESDHNAYTTTEKNQVYASMQQGNNQDAGDDMDLDDEQAKKPAKPDQPTTTTYKAPEPESEYGTLKPQARSGKWASAIRLWDPESGETLEYLELPDNEAAFSVVLAPFPNYQQQLLIKQNQQLSPQLTAAALQELFLVVGTAKDMTLYPRKSASGGFIHVYKILPPHASTGPKWSFQLVHKTPVEEVPYGLCSFQGRLLVGIKNILRIYDMGKKKMLRKCENKNLPNFIVSIHAHNDRIYVGDVTESFHFIKYRKHDNILSIFADDTNPRWITTSTPLDADTMAGADKFGNIFVCQLPQDVTEEVEDVYLDQQSQQQAAALNPLLGAGNANRWVYDRGLLNGAPQKAQEILQFHVGDLVTCLVKTNLTGMNQPGVLLYATISGAIGAMVPFASKQDVDLLTLLEMLMREEIPPLCGRDHLAYRSYYYPVKSVVDGELVEQYALLDASKQQAIATQLEKNSPQEVMKKLEELRHSAGF